MDKDNLVLHNTLANATYYITFFAMVLSEKSN